MNFKTLTKKFFSTAAASALLITNFAVAPKNDDSILKDFDAFAASDVVINTNIKYQNIRGFGGINHPEWTGDKGGDLSAAQRQTAFGNGANELGLTVLRVFVNPDKNQWSKAVPTAKDATSRGDVTIFASPWEPPSNLAASGGTGGLKGKLHLPESNYAAYAQHLNDFGTYMKNQGVDLYAISVQNEPDYAEEWTAWTPDQTTNFIANYGDRITSTRLMSPESFQYGAWNNGKDYYNKILANSKAMANCDLFGTHFYGTPRSKMDFPELEKSGKEIWMTEVYVPNSDADSANRWPEAIQVAENIHNAMVVGNMSAYTWWYIRRSYGLMTDNGVPSKRGWCMAQYSKYIRPGAVRVECTEMPAGDNVLVSAYKKGSQVTVVAVNKGNDTYTQSFSIGSGEKILSVDRYRTSANENVAVTSNLENNGKGFFASLPGNSVSTFVIKTDAEGDPDPNPDPDPQPAQPDENGFYFHDTFEDGADDWEVHGAGEITQSGRIPYKGTNSLLVQNRESSWQGIQKKLGSGFEAGKEYSFSVVATTNNSAASTLKFSLQYTDSEGETKFANIATASTAAEEYVQLANPNFKLPEGGSNFIIYVETTEGTDNIYIDEAIGAVAGKTIEGPAPVTYTLGDIDNDGVIDSIDTALLRRGVIKNNLTKVQGLAADVNQDKSVNIADIVMLQQYILGKIDKFEKAQSSAPDPSTEMRTISVYTPVVQQSVVEYDPVDVRSEKAGVQYGEIQQKSYYSQFCGREKKYNVLLPAGYTTSKKYPVMYVMHGYWENQDRMIIKGNSDMYTRQMVGNLIASGEAKEMILVFPYIYSSQSQNDCSAMDDTNNIAYDNFDTVLTTELMPLIEKDYSVATGRENTAITGFSMGGRESLNIGQKHPDLFGYVGAICPAPGATGQWKFASEEAAPSLIFITAGGNDDVVYTTPNGYHENFTKNNVPHIWHYVNGGYHGDNSIHAHLYNFVKAAFKA